MLDFLKLKAAVERQFYEMATSGDLFVTGVTSDEMWTRYLASFPAGTNPMFRERTEHDCSCCRHFIRDIGNVVAIRGGRLVTIWDVETGEPAYDEVVAAMARLVGSSPITDVFLHRERAVGTDKNFDASFKEWRHFRVELPRRNAGRPFFCKGEEIATKLSEERSRHDVLERALKELTADSVNTAIELISQNSLYKGKEYEPALYGFKDVQEKYASCRTTREAELMVWQAASGLPPFVSKIRNTAIGTLLIDLSEGMELEEAVGRYEKTVAPENYKRPTALVTKAMVERARTKIQELGLESALHRRFATFRDLHVNDVLYVGRSSRGKMMGDVFDQINVKASSPKNLERIETMPIETFLASVDLRGAELDVFLDNKLESRMVSLIAPVDPGAGRLMRWGNEFSWSYVGDLADSSIKERVRKAGGNVTGDICCRLAWHNFDDLDLHMVEASHGRAAGYEIYYGNRGHLSPSGGQLDVDANAGGGGSRQPVENIFYGDRRRMRDGTYTLFVHQFHQMEKRDVGFEVEIDCLGEVRRYSSEQELGQKRRVDVARIKVRDGSVEIEDLMPSSTTSRDLWGLKTQTFVPVSTLMRSPNHWEGAGGIGNRHYFFFLEGCQNPGDARGFYNEFLRPELTEHRKVIEMVGARMRTESTPDQLSGIGFADTRRAEVLVRVGGSFNRQLRLTF